MKKVYSLASLLVLAGASQAGLLDFESETPGFYDSYTTVVDGVSVEITTDDPFSYGFEVYENSANFPASWGNQSLSPFANEVNDFWFIMNFGLATDSVINSFSMEVGDFGGDTDVIELLAFDGDGLLVDSFGSAWSGNLGNGDSPLTASVSGSGIVQVIFRGGSSGSSFNSVYYDNMNIDVVPEPATLSVLGLGALALFRKKRKS